MREINYLKMKKEEKPLICLNLKELYTLARNQSSLLSYEKQLRYDPDTKQIRTRSQILFEPDPNNKHNTRISYKINLILLSREYFL